MQLLYLGMAIYLCGGLCFLSCGVIRIQPTSGHTDILVDEYLTTTPLPVSALTVNVTNLLLATDPIYITPRYNLELPEYNDTFYGNITYGDSSILSSNRFKENIASYDFHDDLLLTQNLSLQDEYHSPTNSIPYSDSSVPYLDMRVSTTVTTITTVLAILGFSCTDMGFDTATTLARAFAVDAVPSTERNGILMLATATQAVVGVCTASVGVIDLPATIRELFGVDGSAGTLVVFGSIMCFIAIFGVVLTTVVDRQCLGLSSTKSDEKKQRYQEVDHSKEQSWNQIKTSSYQRDIPHTNGFKTDEDPMNPESNFAVVKPSSVFLPDNAFPYEHTSSRKPLIPKTNNGRAKSYTENRNSVSESLGEHGTRRDKYSVRDLVYVMDRRFVAVLVGYFFAMGCSCSFTIYLSNAITVEILHGDPQAPEGSPGHLQYETGLMTSAVGNLVMYATYMALSLVNARTTAVLGEKLQYCTTNFLFVALMFSLVVFKKLELYYATMVVGGFYRTCIFNVTYVLANKYARDNLKRSSGLQNCDHQSSVMGKAMALLGFQLPCHFFLLSTLMGPLMEASGNPFMPVIYSLVCAAMSLLAFASLYFMKDS